MGVHPVNQEKQHSKSLCDEKWHSILRNHYYINSCWSSPGFFIRVFGVYFRVVSENNNILGIYKWWMVTTGSLQVPVAERCVFLLLARSGGGQVLRLKRVQLGRHALVLVHHNIVLRVPQVNSLHHECQF